MLVCPHSQSNPLHVLARLAFKALLDTELKRLVSARQHVRRKQLLHTLCEVQVNCCTTADAFKQGI